MTPLRTLALALFTAALAEAGVDAKLVGTWTAPGMTIQIEANGRCMVNQEVGKCQTLLRALMYQQPNGQVLSYGWKISGDELTISGNGLNQVFRRGTAAGAAPAQTPAEAPQAPTATAGRWSHPFWGLDFALPAGWKANERDGLVLLGSDTEPGLIIVRFLPQTTAQMLQAGYPQGLQESGVNLMPTMPIERFANNGLAGELSGMGQDGSRLTARVVGIPTPFGDSAVVLGLTTTEKYAGLKSRVDALAASAQFTRPKLPPANVSVAGQYGYIYVSTSGGAYSREDYLSLCNNGMFRRKGEMYGSGNAGSAVVSGGYAGNWTADGGGQNGTITLQYRNGQTERLRYQKSGPDLVLNGKKYGRSGGGDCR